MLNRKKAAREAAVALLGLSMAHFDGKDQEEQGATPQKTDKATRMFALVTVVGVLVWALAIWTWATILR